MRFTLLIKRVGNEEVGIDSVGLRLRMISRKEVSLQQSFPAPSRRNFELQFKKKLNKNLKIIDVIYK